MDELEKLITVYSDNLQGLLKIAYSVVADYYEAQDVVQDVIIRLVANPQRCSSISSPLSFLRTCVRNEAVDHIRRRVTPPVPFEQLLVKLENTLPEDEYREIDELLSIRSCLDKQSPEFRDAFVRHVLDGWTIKDLAKELGVTTGCLQKQFLAVKRRMKKNPALFFTFIFVFC